MRRNDPDEINRLIGEFTDLQEIWEGSPGTFDWKQLQVLARKGAHAYNEDSGPSFHALALDGVQHSEFHERFLAESLRADFDPFKLSKAGTGVAPVPVIDHGDLAEAALFNPCSARMRALLMELARARFAALTQDMTSAPPGNTFWWYGMVEACAESIPLDLLEQLAPELARPHHGETRRQAVDPTEAYLSSAEIIVETHSRPYG